MFKLQCNFFFARPFDKHI